MLQLTVTEKQSLKEFTENNYAQAAFFWNTLLKDREIKVNGKRVGENILVNEGDCISYYLTVKQAEKPAFYPVYEDGLVCVVDKESGVNSEAVFAELSRRGEYYFLHRLDRNTKGLLLFAKTPQAEGELLQAFKDRQINKRYHALCFGKFPKPQGVLTAYLQKDADKSLVKIYDAPKGGAEKIVTEYEVLESFAGKTKVEVTLHTGKTHQIRAHLAHIGCPIVGDMKYGNSGQNREEKAARQYLVAKYLQVELGGALAHLNEREWISRFDV